MYSLKDDSTKILVIQLDEEGLTQEEISIQTGMGKSTIGDFLRGESFASFWRDYGGVKETLEEEPTKLGGRDIYRIETSKSKPDGCTHFFIPDTQCKEGINMSYLKWIGEYIVDRMPDVIIHIGDHADMPSLSSYDKGTKKAEGKRLHHDIDAAIEGMNILLKPLYELQQKQLAETGKISYKPKMVLTLGNHEERIMRHVNANPELSGFLSYDNLRYKEMGWDVYDFLQPVIVNGVTYCHYMANPMTGKPYGGMASTVLKNVGESFTVGHAQKLDIATRHLPSSGRQQWAIVAGACYLHDEGYKGYQGNHHWRGVIVKHGVENGSYNPMFIDLDYLRKRYD